MATWAWVVIAIVVVAVMALVAVGASKRRTAMLRDRFGPEYDRVVEGRDGRRAAEADLRAREKQRAQFDVKPLPESTRLRFADEWRDVQEHASMTATPTTTPASPQVLRHPGTPTAAPRTPPAKAASQPTPNRGPACWRTANCRA